MPQRLHSQILIFLLPALLFSVFPGDQWGLLWVSGIAIVKVHPGAKVQLLLESLSFLMGILLITDATN